MRTIAIATLAILALGGTAVAQMCGGAQSPTTTAQAGSMGCMGMQRAQADDPMADSKDSKPVMAGGMCPCCKNMAMMGGMKMDGNSNTKHDMPMAPKE